MEKEKTTISPIGSDGHQADISIVHSDVENSIWDNWAEKVLNTDEEIELFKEQQAVTIEEQIKLIDKNISSDLTHEDKFLIGCRVYGREVPEDTEIEKRKYVSKNKQKHDCSKYYLSFIISRVIDEEEMIHDPDSTYKRVAMDMIYSDIMEDFFEDSEDQVFEFDNITDYFEVLTYSHQSAIANLVVSRIIALNIYDYINRRGGRKEFETMLDNKSAIDKISQIYCITDLIKQVQKINNNGEYESKIMASLSDNIKQAIKNIIENQQTEPLVRIIAEYELSSLINNTDDYEYDRSISPSQQIFEVSDNAKYIIDENGTKRNVYKIPYDSNQDMSIDEVKLLQIAYKADVITKIESEIGIKLSEIPLKAQLRFLKYASESDQPRYVRLIDQLARYDDKLDKKNLINAFLSLEFGEDFGNSILSISENTDKDESLEIFKIINEFSEISKKFGEIYKNINPEIAKGAEKAMRERLTDILALIEDIATNGPKTYDVAPHKHKEGYADDGRFDITINSVEEIIETLKLFLKSQQILQSVLSDKNTLITERLVDDSDKEGSPQYYALINGDKGFVGLHTRERGASGYDKVIEYGNSRGVEASVGWSVDPTNPYYISLNKEDSTNVVNIRFDREGRQRDESPDSDSRSPINENGLVSLDIGSVIGNEKDLAVRLGRMVAAGNEIRFGKNGSSKRSLNHIVIDSVSGDADEFAKFVQLVKEKIEKSYKKPTKKEIIKIANKLMTKSHLLRKDRQSIAS